MRSYRDRISGPLLDRIDLHVPVEPVDPRALHCAPPGETSSTVRARVITARARQHARLGDEGITCNAHMRPAHINRFCALDDTGRRLLLSAMDRLALSARAHDRILKVARTIADLAGADAIAPRHLAEAIQYRQLDRAES